MTPTDPPLPDSSGESTPEPTTATNPDGVDTTDDQASLLTLRFSTTTDITAYKLDLVGQVLRDGKPLTRPTHWAHGFGHFGHEPGGLNPATWKLFPGSINNGEFVNVTVFDVGMLSPRWRVIRVGMAIDGQVWEARPGLLYIPLPPLNMPDSPNEWHDWSGDWSAAIHFPVMSDADTFRGIHTLLLRAEWMSKA